MPKHKCPRCGYKTRIVSDMKKHLLRKNECDPILKNDIVLFEKKLN